MSNDIKFHISRDSKSQFLAISVFQLEKNTVAIIYPVYYFIVSLVILEIISPDRT